ncbi:DnaJ protein [Rhizoctonia solani]|uniref:DnaJ protein n=1 Tax=Rhizoctonia solani TaxID=456999 RepID=A0A8H7M037_9AGAM|nr:DnaJ protein [Rhizoctonia solani]
MDDWDVQYTVMSVDHYQALGLKRENDPNIDDIQNAYRHLALQWHPERNKGTAKRETAALKFIEINEAYKVLMDKKMRESKEAAKGKKSKKDERAMSPSADSMNPDGRSRSRPRWSAAALMSRAQQNATPDIMVSGADEHKDDGDRQSARDSFEAPRVSMAPSHTPAPARSTFASPQHTGRSRSRSPGPRTLAHSREPSPAPTAIQGRTGPETPITAPTPTRVYPENSRASYNTVRSPPAVYSLDQDVRLPRYLKGMSDVTSEIGSESSYFNGHSVSVAGSSSSASTHIPDDWLFPIYLSLEDLYTCKTHRFRINRHLLTGQTKEVFVDVSVQPNWRDGTQLRCKGLGNEREGLPPQDVIFIVKEKLHPRFLRDPVGYDIYARLEISLVIALVEGPLTTKPS